MLYFYYIHNNPEGGSYNYSHFAEKETEAEISMAKVLQKEA